MDNELLEFLYRSGKMPFKYYAQQNGKSPQENYRLSKEEIKNKIVIKEKVKETIQNQIQEEIEKILSSLKI